MTVKVSNIRARTAPDLDLADLTVTYGRRVESYRDVVFDAAGVKQVSDASSLVNIALSAGGQRYFTSATVPDIVLAALPPNNLISTFSAGDFNPVFRNDGPLDKVDVFNLLVLPGIADTAVTAAALAFAEHKQAFVILDPPANAIADQGNAGVDTLFGGVPRSQNGAFYFPYLKSASPLDGAPIELPPSGFVAGVYARTDTRRGVWKAPAGLEATIPTATGVVETGRMTEPRHGILNNAGINCLRTFPNIGTVVFGSRTLVAANPAFQQNMYVPVRRMTLFIEQTLLANLKWVVFEPNDEPLWIAIRTTIENFMLALFNQDALQGSKPSDAFVVKCDRSTTTPDDQATGRVNIVVGFAPLKPAEFVIIRISHLAGQTPA
jgi:phage tail sheath protein FI